MNPSVFKGKLWILSSLPVVGHQARGGIYSEIVSQPFLAPSVWFPSPLSDVKELLVTVFRVLFPEEIVPYIAIHLVSLGRGELRIFLCLHLE